MKQVYHFEVGKVYKYAFKAFVGTAANNVETYFRCTEVIHSKLCWGIVVSYGSSTPPMFRNNMGEKLRFDIPGGGWADIFELDDVEIIAVLL